MEGLLTDYTKASKDDIRQIRENAGKRFGLDFSAA